MTAQRGKKHAKHLSQQLRDETTFRDEKSWPEKVEPRSKAPTTYFWTDPQPLCLRFCGHPPALSHFFRYSQCLRFYDLPPPTTSYISAVTHPQYLRFCGPPLPLSHFSRYSSSIWGFSVFLPTHFLTLAVTHPQCLRFCGPPLPLSHLSRYSSSVWGFSVFLPTHFLTLAYTHPQCLRFFGLPPHPLPYISIYSPTMFEVLWSLHSDNDLYFEFVRDTLGSLHAVPFGDSRPKRRRL